MTSRASSRPLTPSELKPHGGRVVGLSSALLFHVIPTTVAPYLSVTSVVALSRCCRALFVSLNTPMVWQQLVAGDFHIDTNDVATRYEAWCEGAHESARASFAFCGHPDCTRGDGASPSRCVHASKSSEVADGTPIGGAPSLRPQRGTPDDPRATSAPAPTPLSRSAARSSDYREHRDRFQWRALYLYLHTGRIGGWHAMLRPRRDAARAFASVGDMRRASEAISAAILWQMQGGTLGGLEPLCSGLARDLRLRCRMLAMQGRMCDAIGDAALSLLIDADERRGAATTALARQLLFLPDDHPSGVAPIGVSLTGFVEDDELFVLHSARGGGAPTLLAANAGFVVAATANGVGSSAAPQPVPRLAPPLPPTILVPGLEAAPAALPAISTTSTTSTTAGSGVTAAHSMTREAFRAWILRPDFEFERAYDSVMCGGTVFDRAAFLFVVAVLRGPSHDVLLHQYLLCDVLRCWPERLVRRAGALDGVPRPPVAACGSPRAAFAGATTALRAEACMPVPVPEPARTGSGPLSPTASTGRQPPYQRQICDAWRHFDARRSDDAVRAAELAVALLPVPVPSTPASPAHRTKAEGDTNDTDNSGTPSRDGGDSTEVSPRRRTRVIPPPPMTFPNPYFETGPPLLTLQALVARWKVCPGGTPAPPETAPAATTTAAAVAPPSAVVAAAPKRVSSKGIAGTLRDPAVLRKLPSDAGFAFFTLGFVAQCPDIGHDAYVRHLLTEPPEGRRAVTCNNLGSLALQRGNHIEALSWLHVARESNPRYFVTYKNLCKVLLRLGQRVAAHALLVSAAILCVPNSDLFAERSKYSLSPLPDLATAAALNPRLSYPYRYRAALAMDANDGERAIAELNAIVALTLEPSDLSLRATFKRDMGRVTDGLDDMLLAATLSPRNGEYRAWIAATVTRLSLTRGVTPATRLAVPRSRGGVPISPPFAPAMFTTPTLAAHVIATMVSVFPAAGGVVSQHATPARPAIAVRATSALEPAGGGEAACAHSGSSRSGGSRTNADNDDASDDSCVLSGSGATGSGATLAGVLRRRRSSSGGASGGAGSPPSPGPSLLALLSADGEPVLPCSRSYSEERSRTPSASPEPRVMCLVRQALSPSPSPSLAATHSPSPRRSEPSPSLLCAGPGSDVTRFWANDAPRAVRRVVEIVDATCRLPAATTFVPAVARRIPPPPPPPPLQPLPPLSAVARALFPPEEGAAGVAAAVVAPARSASPSRRPSPLRPAAIAALVLAPPGVVPATFSAEDGQEIESEDGEEGDGDNRDTCTASDSDEADCGLEHHRAGGASDHGVSSGWPLVRGRSRRRRQSSVMSSTSASSAGGVGAEAMFSAATGSASFVGSAVDAPLQRSASTPADATSLLVREGGGGEEGEAAAAQAAAAVGRGAENRETPSAFRRKG